MAECYNIEKIRSWVEQIERILKSTEIPEINQKKIDELCVELDMLYKQRRRYRFEVGPINSEIAEYNEKMRNSLKFYQELRIDLFYATDKNIGYINNLYSALDISSDNEDASCVLCNVPPHIELPSDLDKLKLSIQVEKTNIEIYNTQLVHYNKIKNSIDSRYLNLDRDITNIKKLIADEKQPRFEESINLEIRRFRRLELMIVELYDQYIEYAKKHNLGTDCYQYNSIEYLPNLESLIAPKISTADYDHKLVIEFESFMNHIVTVCNEHYYFNLLETYVHPCEHYNGDNVGEYIPGSSECSHGYRMQWEQNSKYGIGKLNMEFGDDDRLKFTILSKIPPGRARLQRL
jgi:hypothetical protein